MAKAHQATEAEQEALKAKFFEAIDAGLSVNAASAAAGVHGSTGGRWKEMRETGAKAWVTKARDRREEMVAHSYKHGVEATAKKYKTTMSSVYSARYAVRVATGEVGKPPPAAGKRPAATNGHAEEPVRKTATKAPVLQARAEPVEVSAVTTATAFSATMKVMQILEPLPDADRARVAKAVLQFVQGGIG